LLFCGGDFVDKVTAATYAAGNVVVVMAKVNDTDGGRGGASKQGQRSAAPAARFNAVQFVTYALRQDEKDTLKERGVHGPSLDDDLIGSLAGGYKLTVKWDAFTEAYAAWLVAPEGHETNAGMILSGRGSSPMKALRQVLYIHVEVCRGDWRPLRGAVKVQDDD
jgi:hypothetical protein